MSNRTTKSLIYKVARFNNEQNGNELQVLLERALADKGSALGRKYSGENENSFRLINYNGPYKGMRVCEFIDYTEGHAHQAARLDENADELPISSLVPADESENFLHSILYFGVHKNSVVISQTQTIRSQHLEHYLNQFLRDCGFLSNGDFLSLCDQPPMEAATMIAETKSIEFARPVTFETQDQQGNAVSRNDVSAVQLNAGSFGIDALMAMLPEDFQIPLTMRREDIVRDSALEVTLMLKYKHLKRGSPTDFLDQISNQLRHIDSELDYTIHTRSGQIKRDDLKLKKSFGVGANRDGLVHKHELWEKMAEWLSDLAHFGQITN